MRAGVGGGGGVGGAVGMGGLGTAGREPWRDTMGRGGGYRGGGWEPGTREHIYSVPMSLRAVLPVLLGFRG